MLISDLPDEKRPREKMAQEGAESLSDAELLAIFLRVGVAGQSAIAVGQRLLEDHGGLAALGALNIAQLTREHGLGPAKAAQLAAAFELGVRLAREEGARCRFDSPLAAFRVFGPQLGHLAHETLRLVLLDTRLQATRFLTLSEGNLNSTIAHPRDILHPVVLHESHGFLLVHNHPSGDPTPSQADRELTRRVAAGASLLQVEFLDHIVIGRASRRHEGYFSFRDSGLL